MTAVISQIAVPGRPLRVLEVGSWLGFSALTWAYAIRHFCPQGGEVVCIDPFELYFDGSDSVRSPAREMHGLIRSGLALALFSHNVRCGPPGIAIRHIHAASAGALARLAGQKFDLIYIDGNHQYEAVLNDLKGSLPLLEKRGVICGDDLDLQIGEVDEAVAAAHPHADIIIDPASGEVFHPGVTLAVYRVLGRVHALSPFWSMRKTVDGFEPIEPRRGAIIIPGHFTSDMRLEAQRLLVPMASATSVGPHSPPD